MWILSLIVSAALLWQCEVAQLTDSIKHKDEGETAPESLFVFPEAHPGPPFHRVPPASLYLQREPFGHRETPQLPGQRGPELHLPGGPDMCLQRLSDQHHWMHHIRVTGGEDTYKNIYTSCTLITTQIFHDFYKNVGLNKQIKTLKEDKRDIHIIVAVIIIFRSLSAEKMWSTLDHLFGW